MSRISSFREYSVFFVDTATTQECFVHTWDDNALFSVCIRVEPAGQRVPVSELAGLSRIMDSVPSCQLPLSCQGGSVSLLRVLNDNRIDGRQFLYCQEFADDSFLRCYRLAEQEIFGRLDVASVIDFVTLRLRGALQEAWMEGTPALRRCVLSGHVAFADLCSVSSELVANWKIVREFVRFTGPGHARCEVDKVSSTRFVIGRARGVEIVRFAICHVVSNNREGRGCSVLNIIIHLEFWFVADARIGLAD